MKKVIQKLSKEFNLKFNSTWFKSILVSKRENILMEYIGMCPDPAYNKYGKDIDKRIKNINKFINSDQFKKCLKRYGGQVISQKELNKIFRAIKKLEDSKIKTECLNICKKIQGKIKKEKIISILTKTSIQKEKKEINKIKRHEYIHVLLEKNKIKFQDISKKYWVYDEGINEYMGAYLDKTLDRLEKFRDKEKYAMEKKYWVYAIKFRELLKDKKTPKERKKAFLDLISNLKKQSHA